MHKVKGRSYSWVKSAPILEGESMFNKLALWFLKKNMKCNSITITKTRITYWNEEEFQNSRKNNA